MIKCAGSSLLRVCLLLSHYRGLSSLGDSSRLDRTTGAYAGSWGMHAHIVLPQSTARVGGMCSKRPVYWGRMAEGVQQLRGGGLIKKKSKAGHVMRKAKKRGLWCVCSCVLFVYRREERERQSEGARVRENGIKRDRVYAWAYKIEPEKASETEKERARERARARDSACAWEKYRGVKILCVCVPVCLRAREVCVRVSVCLRICVSAYLCVYVSVRLCVCAPVYLCVYLSARASERGERGR